jgi:hypothetical protein
MLTSTEFAPSPQNVANFGDALARGAFLTLNLRWNSVGREVGRMGREAIDERY